MALDLTTNLSTYVDEVGGKVLGEVLANGTTLEFATIQDGVKHSQLIYKLTDDMTITTGIGSGYATTESDVTASSRDLNVDKRTVNGAITMAQLETYGLGQDVEGTDDVSAAIVAAITDNAGRKFAKANETFMWSAGAGNVTDLATTLAADTTDLSASYAGNSFATAPEAAVDAIYDSMDADGSVAEDLTIFMSVGNFKKYVLALGADLANFNTKANVSGFEISHPTVPNLSIRGVVGLGSSTGAFIGPASDIYVGTDAQDSNFQLWYDINTDKVKYRLTTKLGANIGSPEAWGFIADVA